MKLLFGKILRLLKTADGPTAVEYGVILALIFLVCITAVVMLGKSTKSSFEHSSDQIQSSFGQGNSGQIPSHFSPFLFCLDCDILGGLHIEPIPKHKTSITARDYSYEFMAIKPSP